MLKENIIVLLKNIENGKYFEVIYILTIIFTDQNFSL